jgi:hypothetical protein
MNVAKEITHTMYCRLNMALVIDERAADFWLSEGKVVLID